MRKHFVRCIVGVVSCLSITSAYAEDMGNASWGGVTLEAKEVRAYDLPTDVDPAAMTPLSTRDGTTILYATVGSGRNIACAIIVATDEKASRFDYKYDDQPTQCTSVLPHPDGGFFIRGVDPTAIMGDVTGFTAFVDASGVQQWVVGDQKVVDAKSSAENGTGEFLGVYDGPHASMAYSKRFDKLMAFTNGRLVIGAQNKPVSQAHIMDAMTGRLRKTGQTFGDNTLGVVGGLIDRQSDGYFLLYLFSVGEQGAYFYTYDGRINISKFAPLDEDWSSRIVDTMVYGPQERLTLLWTPNADAGALTRVTAVNDAGNALWNEQWTPAFRTTDGPIDIGRPLGLWAGQNHVLVLHRQADDLITRVIDASNGNQLGIARLADATTLTPTAILNGKNGTLKLLAYDDVGERFKEFELSFTDQPDPMGSVEPEMDMTPDLGLPPNPEDIVPDGCDCAQVQPGQQPSGALLLFAGFAMIGIGLRRRVLKLC